MMFCFLTKGDQAGANGIENICSINIKLLQQGQPDNRIGVGI